MFPSKYCFKTIKKVQDAFTAELFGLLLAKLVFLALSFVQRQINMEVKALIS